MILTAAFFISNALWIPAKAELAQWLMARAWQRTLDGDTDARPWPWADTRPVALLEVSRLGVRQFVLEGASGRNLAFGPAALTGLDSQDIILSGHRDTHFNWIRFLATGDSLRLVTRDGSRLYRVRYSEVVDSSERELVMDQRSPRLTLVTCYPFDSPVAGGPLRYVVTASVDQGA